MKKSLYILFVILIAILVFFAIIFILSKSKGKGALQVTSNPKAKVYLNGKFIGLTPLCLCELKDMITEGDYNLKLISETGSYASFNQKITISQKILTVVDNVFSEKSFGSSSIITLQPIQDKKSTQISIVVFPTDASIYIDNILQGKSPVILNNITESDHELRIINKGYKDKIVRVRTKPGFQLNALIYLGLEEEILASLSAVKKPSISTGSAVIKGKLIKILNTPTGFLRVRAKPTVLSQEVTRVKPGENYQLLQDESGWYEIKINEKETGWVTSQYAEELD